MHRSALEELFRQIAGHVVTSAKPKGLEIQLTVILGESPTWPPAASGWIFSGPTAPRPAQIEWKLSSALATALVSAWREPDPKPAAPTVPPPSSKGEEKLELLMDVELDVFCVLEDVTFCSRKFLNWGRDRCWSWIALSRMRPTSCSTEDWLRAARW